MYVYRYNDIYLLYIHVGYCVVVQCGQFVVVEVSHSQEDSAFVISMSFRLVTARAVSPRTEGRRHPGHRPALSHVAEKRFADAIIASRLFHSRQQFVPLNKSGKSKNFQNRSAALDTETLAVKNMAYYVISVPKILQKIQILGGKLLMLLNSYEAFIERQDSNRLIATCCSVLGMNILHALCCEQRCARKSHEHWSCYIKTAAFLSFSCVIFFCQSVNSQLLATVCNDINSRYHMSTLHQEMHVWCIVGQSKTAPSVGNVSNELPLSQLDVHHSMSASLGAVTSRRVKDDINAARKLELVNDHSAVLLMFSLTVHILYHWCDMPR